MNLDALGNLGDFIGGIAVVITLVYLALQIRQNTDQVRQSITIARAQALRDTLTTAWVFDVAKDPALASLYTAGMQNPEQLPDAEKARFLFLAGTIFGDLERSHMVYEQGLLTAERWEAQVRTLRLHIKQAGGQYYWERFAYTHTHGFAAVVDRERGVSAESR